MSKIHLLRVRVNALERENEMSKKKLSETKSELDRSMDVSRNLRMDSEHDDKPHKPGYDPLEKTTLTKLKDRRKAASLNKTRDNSGGAHERSFTNVKNQVSEGEFNEVHTINVRQANKIKNLKTKNQELKVNLQNVMHSFII